MKEAVIKALTLRQPWASLVAEGVKTIETRTWCTHHRGRIAIHAGQRFHDGEWNLDLGRATHRICGGFEHYPDALPLGAIVASAVLTDCAPIGGPQSFRTGIVEGDEGDYAGQPVVVRHPKMGLFNETLILSTADGRNIAITDQLPLGFYEPGNYAWLLDDIATTEKRCPWCWGRGVVEGRGFDGVDVAYEYACPVCDEAGGCPPIPAKGRQLVWDWNPEKVKA